MALGSVGLKKLTEQQTLGTTSSRKNVTALKPASKLTVVLLLSLVLPGHFLRLELLPDELLETTDPLSAALEVRHVQDDLQHNGSFWEGNDIQPNSRQAWRPSSLLEDPHSSISTASWWETGKRQVYAADLLESASKPMMTKIRIIHKI